MANDMIPQIRERPIFPEDTPPEPSHIVRNLLIIAGVIVVLVGAGVGIFYYSQLKSQEPPVSVQPALQRQEMLAYDSIKTLSFSNEELLDRTALNARIFNEARAVESGTTFFDLNTTLKELLALTSFSIPSELYRALNKEDFFGGTPSGNFFVITFDSYSQVYSGMLEWESSMNSDLFFFFGISPIESIARFEDRIVGNKDARAAIDASGNTLFLYAFYDSKNLIVAKNNELLRSVQEMLLRKNL